jgi:hypothetical protein
LRFDFARRAMPLIMEDIHAGRALACEGQPRRVRRA